MGACGATLNGSVLLSSFIANSGNYEAAGVPVNPVNDTRTNECDPVHPACSGVQDLYFDNIPLRAVGSTGALVAGTFYFDRPNGNVYIFNNPSSHSVEFGVGVAAFGNTNQSVTGVIIKGLIIEKFAQEQQNAAIGDQFPGSGWIIQNNEVRLNHADGINPGSNSTVQGNYIHDNGEKGIGAGGVDTVQVLNNELSANNYAGYDCGNECGGMKLGQVTNVNVIGNYVHDNLGYALQGNSGAPGLWCDVDCGESSAGPAPIVFQNNYVANNGGSGIFCEISHYCTIVNNILMNNGNQDSWGFGQGIAINETDHATVYGNIATGNHIGIGGVQQHRGSGPFGTYEIADLDVHDNVITLINPNEIASGLWTDDGDVNIYSSYNNHYQNDTYNGLNYNSSPFLWSTGGVWDVSQWQGAGNDTTGTFNQ